MRAAIEATVRAACQRHGSQLDPRHDRLAFSIAELCELSGFGRQFIYTEIGAGRLVARKHGRRTFILRPDAEAWLSAAPRIAPKSAALDAVPAATAADGHVEFHKNRREEAAGSRKATRPPGTPRGAKNGSQIRARKNLRRFRQKIAF
jgi:hypothetical protein